MKSVQTASRPKKSAKDPQPTGEGLLARLEKRIVGQPAAMSAIWPYIQMYEAGLAPEGRPAAVFLLLGPTGTGKTRTVEALAEVLHGSEKNLLRIDCGEFQMEHEVAKLIGAPPGYLGHRETQPMLTQQKLAAASSERCGLSLVLFDEIEKAAPSLARLLLGVLDRATLRLGDNTSVNFEHSLIFLTSNVGARGMIKGLRPDFGLGAAAWVPPSETGRRLERIGASALRKRFSPEFVNRLDAIITYQPLSGESLAAILDLELRALQSHIERRLGERAFRIDVPEQGRRFLLRQGASLEHGARELKRTVHRHLTHPLAAMVAGGEIQPGAIVRAEPAEGENGLRLRAENARALRAVATAPECEG